MNNNSNKIIISTGGTAGHIYPAIATAEAFIKKGYSPDSVLFVGAKGKMETILVPKYNLKIKTLNISGLQRGKIIKNLLLPFKIIISLIDSFIIIRRFKPTHIIGFGGYASFPILFMGWLLGKDTSIQEQNSYPGLSNKILTRFTKRVFLGFRGAKDHFKSKRVKYIYSGNPVLESTTSKEYNIAEKLSLVESNPIILITGGSLGAKRLNEFAIMLIDGTDLLSSYNIIWQCGKSYLSQYKDKYSTIKGLYVSDFIENLSYIMRRSHITIARSGASTVAEIIENRVCSILVPSPNVTNNHQYYNALELITASAAILLEDSSSKEDVIASVTTLLASPSTIDSIREQTSLLQLKENPTDVILNALSL